MKKTKFLSICIAVVLLVSIFAMSTSAYWNGVGYVYDSTGTRLGYGNTYTVDTGSDNYSLYAQTRSDVGNVNYIATQALAVAIRGWTTYYFESEIASASNSSASPEAVVTIPSTYTPLEARGIFGINANRVGICYTYNLGSGATECTCNFSSDLIND